MDILSTKRHFIYCAYSCNNGQNSDFDTASILLDARQKAGLVM